MAARIRLKKVGRKGHPSYRVVVLDGRKPRDAKVVADLGHYDPKTYPATFGIDHETALKWLLDGAKATKAARDILSRAGVMAAWDAARRGEDVTFEPKTEAKEAPPAPPKKKRRAKQAAAAAEESAQEAPVEEPAAETVEEPVIEAADAEEGRPAGGAAEEEPEEVPAAPADEDEEPALSGLSAEEDTEEPADEPDLADGSDEVVAADEDEEEEEEKPATDA